MVRRRRTRRSEQAMARAVFFFLLLFESSSSVVGSGILFSAGWTFTATEKASFRKLKSYVGEKLTANNYNAKVIICGILILIFLREESMRTIMFY